MNLQHHFLIAMPTLEDPLFKRSVVYICEHNADGAMGIIINKPLENLNVEGVLAKLDIELSGDGCQRQLEQPVFTGGPMSEDRGFILHTSSQKYASSIDVSPDTMVTTSKDVLEALTTDHHPEHVLVALGYCAWEQQQLENEILENAWLTVPATSDIIFDLPASERWSAAAAKLGINIHMIASEAGHS
ncbi:YqgE/AlgH family protein [Rosenbergiella epipactidis]|uniref:YqgE/AlgH family protein n=1 Tax=Rosenbergiella epipactidis TaxID=1544694 RepID=UPI001F4D983C|nr:YqgE/AlgH family protein [Rosenbergiella epipactidis]